MVEQSRAVRADLLSGSAGRLNRITKSLATTVGREILPDEAADVVGQTAACAAPILAAAADTKEPISWLCEQLENWEREAIQRAQRLSTEYSLPGTVKNHEIRPAHLFEYFLHRYTPK